MKKPNDDLRLYAKQHGVKLWQLAEALQMADTTLSRELRHQVPKERKEEMYEQIRKLSAQGEPEHGQ